MTSRPLLVSDFDGVIVDGMDEYWFSASQACIELIGKQTKIINLTTKTPKSFIALRPWVNHGWEMVLIAAELLKINNQPVEEILHEFHSDYPQRIQDALKSWGWKKNELQQALDSVRCKSISTNKNAWIRRHKAFPLIVDRLKRLSKEDVELVILTTKGKDFTNDLLKHYNLNPKLIFGYESGTKADVLLKLSSSYDLQGFIEDRRQTLETIISTPGLEYLNCYLASWGYLKPQDKKDLPSQIHLLSAKILTTPLATWH